MVIKVKDANLIPTTSETKIVRSLLLPVSNENTKHKIIRDNIKIDPARTVNDPIIKDNKIEFSGGNNSGTISKKTNISRELPPIDDYLKGKIKQVTESDPLLSDINLQDHSTLALTSSILSAINVPEVEPIKLTINVLTAGNKKNELKKNIEQRNAEGIGKNLVNFTKSYWSTITSGAKLTDMVAKTSMELGFISAGTVRHVGKATGTVSKVANKLALPFSVAGTGIAVYDVTKDVEKLSEKREELRLYYEDKGKIPAKEVIGSIYPGYQERKLNKEIGDKKVNIAMRSVGAGITAISTGALIVSVVNPRKAAMATSVSLAASVAGGISLALADEKLRESMKRKVIILKERYLG